MSNVELSNVIVDFDGYLKSKFAVLDAQASGDNLIVPAISGKKIYVVGILLTADRAVNVRFRSGIGGTPLTGQLNLSPWSAVVLPWNHLGWFETAVGSSLNLDLSSAVAVGGCLVYVER